MSRFYVAVAAAVLIATAATGWAAGAAKEDSVKVVVEGSLGAILFHEDSDLVNATILAGDGELVIDASASKTARQDLARLRDQFFKGGSTTFVVPRLKVTGQLKYRATSVTGVNGEVTEGPKAWVLSADSVAIKEP